MVECARIGVAARHTIRGGYRVINSAAACGNVSAARCDATRDDSRPATRTLLATTQREPYDDTPRSAAYTAQDTFLDIGRSSWNELAKQLTALIDAMRALPSTTD